MTNKIYSIFDKISGRIKSRKQIPLSWLDVNYDLATEDYVEADTDSRINYVDTGTGLVENRVSLSANWDKTSIVSDGIDTAVLSGLPLNVTVFIDDAPFIVVDGTLNFTATSPGEYHFMIDEVQYLKKEWIINVT